MGHPNVRCSLDGGDEGVLVVLDAGEELAQGGGEQESDGGEQDDRGGGPEGEGVPLPEPEAADEVDGVGPGRGEKQSRRERNGAGAEDTRSPGEERDEEHEFDRVHKVIRELRGGEVEAEDGGEGERDEGGRTEERIDAYDETEGDTPGELLGCGSHAEESEDGQRYATVEEGVADGFSVGGHWIQDRLRRIRRGELCWFIKGGWGRNGKIAGGLAGDQADRVLPGGVGGADRRPAEDAAVAGGVAA